MNSDNFADKLLEKFLVDAYGEDEQLWAFRQVIEDEVPFTSTLLHPGGAGDDPGRRIGFRVSDVTAFIQSRAGHVASLTEHAKIPTIPS